MIKYQNGTKDVFKDEIEKKDSVIIPKKEKLTFKNDILILQNGDTLNVRIGQISSENIYYNTLNDSVNLWVHSKGEIKEAFYKDGSQVWVNPTNTIQTNITGSSSTLYLSGQNDAEKYYNKYGGAVTATVLTTTLVSGFFGLIPAIACSNTFPKTENLGLANNEKLSNQAYYNGYLEKAKKIKSRAVWTGWGYGMLANLFCVIVYYSLTK
jgi:hypothetical protein